MGDWRNNMNVGSNDYCNLELGFHQGFITELVSLDKCVTRILFDYLAQRCWRGVYMAGHSLGGALATLTAACYTHRWGPSFDKAFVALPKFLGLYTFGAPAVTKMELKQGGINVKEQGECFPGTRFFNSDNNFHEGLLR